MFAIPTGAVSPSAFPSSIPPSPFALTPGKDDTCLFQDARAGFSHLVPGRPLLGIPAPAPSAPPADAILQLQDAPISIRYRLEPPSLAASTATDLAHGTAERYGQWRAQAPIPVDHANPTWLASWGVEAAAVAAYELASSTPGVTLREDLFVLVRQGMVLHVTWTYPRAFLDEPAYASFASVAEATMIWDSARWDQHGRVWPESAFLGAGLYAVPHPRYREMARLVALSCRTPEERKHLLTILAGIVSGAGAPWVSLGPDMLESSRRVIASALRDPQARALIDGAFVEIATAHDLRGLAVLLGRAVDPRTAAPSDFGAKAF